MSHWRTILSSIESEAQANGIVPTGSSLTTSPQPLLDLDRPENNRTHARADRLLEAVALMPLERWHSLEVSSPPT
jgi:hypothetical protein